jgi:hypothetical protein
VIKSAPRAAFDAHRHLVAVGINTLVRRPGPIVADPSYPESSPSERQPPNKVNRPEGYSVSNI